MPPPTIRYAGHVALERLEWIERHISARPDDPTTRAKLESAIEDLRHLIVTKMIGGYSERNRARKLVYKRKVEASLVTYPLRLDLINSEIQNE